jgi:Na+/proline symporter
VVQIAIMLLSTLLFAVVVVGRAGGLEAVHDQIHALFANGGPGGIRPSEILAFTPDRAKEATGAVLLLFALQWLIQINADGTGYLAQRSMACRDARQAKIAAVVFTFTQIVVRSLLWLPLGLGLLVLFPPDLSLQGGLMQADRESTFVRGMAELLPAGVRGLMLTGMLAALASTVDTHINWGSSYCANDLYKRIVCQELLGKEPGPRTLVWVARLSNLFMVALALVIMTQLTSINQAWQTSLLLGAGLGIVLVLRWLWWRMNVWGEIAAIAASMVAAPILLKSVEQGAARMLIIAVVATAAALLAVFLAGPENRDKLEAFYRKVRPPGFWFPIARQVDPDGYRGPAVLKRSLGAMLLSSLSVFCLLTGIGSWLVGSPPPLFFPWPLLWSLGLIAVGLGLCPLWIRLGFTGDAD